MDFKVKDALSCLRGTEAMKSERCGLLSRISCCKEGGFFLPFDTLRGGGRGAQAVLSLYSNFIVKVPHGYIYFKDQLAFSDRNGLVLCKGMNVLLVILFKVKIWPKSLILKEIPQLFISRWNNHFSLNTGSVGHNSHYLHRSC